MTKNFINYLYVPIEFKMQDTTDIIRGTDSDIQNKTDIYMKEIMDSLNIKYTTINGSENNRFKILNRIFKVYKKEGI
jgi:hypothetical protein